MAKALTKPIFGLPSVETIAAVEITQTSHELQSATFKFQAKMRELERAFEAKAGELRAEYIEDIRTLTGDAE
jgi:hypothetical protein